MGALARQNEAHGSQPKPLRVFLGRWRAWAGPLRLLFLDGRRPRLRILLALEIDADDAAFDDIHYLRSAFRGWQVGACSETRIRLVPPAFGGKD